MTIEELKEEIEEYRRNIIAFDFGVQELYLMGELHAIQNILDIIEESE